MASVNRINKASRQRVFLIITLSIPVLFFLLLEAGLRLAGYGKSYPLFIPVAGAPAYLKASPEVIGRFVVNESHVPDVTIWPVPFLAHKAPGTLRIIVQGGSTAAGWPYGFGASPGGMLRQRLQATLPLRDVEVITTAMTAMNSYALLDFADEIIAQQPDAVLIYAGHNEYLGVLGVGSAVSAGRSRAVILAYLALRDLRILQLLQHAWQQVSATEPVTGAGSELRGTLMHRIVGESRIPLGSPLYHQGEAQFRANLAALLERYHDAGIPVFIGTLASNEKDLEPFVSALAPGTDAAAWQRLFESGKDALDDGAVDMARRSFEAALALDDGAASGYFALGRLYESEGDYSAARAAYLAARDRDQLRFRAPQSFNRVIREVAAAHAAHVVGVEAGLLGRTTHGIIGKELMLEHLHPNLEGYFLLADAYYRALLESGIPGAVAEAVPEERAWREIPVTAVDRQKGVYEIAHLTADWPFREGTAAEPRIPLRASRVEQIAWDLHRRRTTWSAATRELLLHYTRQGDTTHAAGVAVLVADARAHDEVLQVEAGKLALTVGRYRDAVRLLRRALHHAPGRAEYLAVLQRACKASGDDACLDQDRDRLRKPDLVHPQGTVTVR